MPLSLLFFQTERHSPLLGLRSRPSLDGGKMRASVRMTRYLESWGAAKPFANLHHRDSMTTDNGKINTTVSTMQCSQSFKHTHTTQMQILVDEWSDSSLRMFQWGSTTYREEKGELGATLHLKSRCMKSLCGSSVLPSLPSQVQISKEEV